MRLEEGAAAAVSPQWAIQQLLCVVPPTDTGAFVRDAGGVDGDDRDAAKGPGRLRPQGLFVRSRVSSRVADSGVVAGATADSAVVLLGRGAEGNQTLKVDGNFLRLRSVSCFPRGGKTGGVISWRLRVLTLRPFDFGG